MTPEENNDRPARPRVRLVCVGRTYIKKVQPGLVFREVAADGSLGNERIYSQKSLKHIRVGAVYEVEIDPEKPSSIYTHTMRWLHLWENKTEAAVWQASADAFDTLEVVRRQQKKDERRKLPWSCWSPFVRSIARRTEPGGSPSKYAFAYPRRVTISEEPQ